MKGKGTQPVCYSENHKGDAFYSFKIWYILTLAEMGGEPKKSSNATHNF